jgi:protein-L-isoaspartate(D-aspartate) O-methyltransferase
MPDFAARRRIMVSSQVRPHDVYSLPLLQAMLHVPRERFVPDALVEAAYVGEHLPLGPGRVILDPRTMSKMLEALAVGSADLVLDVAPGLGYSSAVIAQMAEAVIALEPDEQMAAEAEAAPNAREPGRTTPPPPEAALAASDVGNVIVEHGPAAEGAPRHAPYDALIIQGGIERMPPALEDQLKEGGRAVALFMDGAMGRVRLGVKRMGVLRWRDAFDSAAPVLEGFARERSFAL